MGGEKKKVDKMVRRFSSGIDFEGLKNY